MIEYDSFWTFITFTGILIERIESALINCKVLSMAHSLLSTPFKRIAPAIGITIAAVTTLAEDSPRDSIVANSASSATNFGRIDEST